MNFTQMKKVFASVLQPLGYQNRKGLFYRKNDDIFIMIELEKVTWGKSYNFNFGVYIDETGNLTEPPNAPLTPIAHVQSRIQFEVTQPLLGKYLRALRLTEPMSDEERAAVLKEALTQHVLPRLETVDSFDKIIAFFRPDNYRTFIPTNEIYEIIERRTGLDFRPKPLTPEQKREAEELYQQELKEMRQVLEPMGIEIEELPTDRAKPKEKSKDVKNRNKGSTS